MSGMRASAPLPSPTSQQGSGQASYGQPFAPSRPSPSPAPILPHQNSYGSHGSNSQANVPQTPLYQPQQTYNQYNPATPPVPQQVNPISYSSYRTASPNPRPVQQPTTSHTNHSNVYNPPRTIEVYTLPDAAVSSIPADIRSQFHRDDSGRVLFYTTPPLDANPIPENKQALGHSLRYLADKARNKEEDERKRKAHFIQIEAEASDRLKRMKTDIDGKQQRVTDQKIKAIQRWCEDMDKGTDELYEQMHGHVWKQARKVDLCRLAIAQEEASMKQREIEEFQKQRIEGKEIKITNFKWI